MICADPGREDGVSVPRCDRIETHMVDLRRVRRWLPAAIVLLALLAVPVFAQDVPAPVINEFVFNHAGADNSEYVEVVGVAASGAGELTLLVVEGDGPAAGTIDRVYGVGRPDSDGRWSTGFLNGELENGTQTLLLVEGFAGSIGDALDADADGAFDAEPWGALLDAVAVTDGDAADVTYTDVVLDAAYDGGAFDVGGASRIPDGADTGSAADWVRNDFDGAGLPDFDAGAAPGGAINTPGSANALAGAATPGPTAGPPGAPTAESTGEPTPEPLNVTIAEIQTTDDPAGDSPLAGQLVTTRGVVTAVMRGGDAFIQDGAGPWSGLFLYRPDGAFGVGDAVSVTGVVEEYDGLTEIAEGAVVRVDGGDPLPEPEVLPSGDIGQEQWEGVLIRVEDATVTEAAMPSGQWAVDDGSGALLVDDMAYAYEPAVDAVLGAVQGPLYYSAGEFKVEPRGAADVRYSLTIPGVQGRGQRSPYAGEVVETAGVITLLTADGDHFWMQDPLGDDDPATSDGVFVDGGGAFAQAAGRALAAGDRVRVVATVDEQQFGAALPLTRLTNVVALDVLGRAATPAPVVVEDLPDVSIPNAIAYWEALEGMLVSVSNAPVVGPTNAFGEFVVLTRPDARPGSGYVPSAGQVFVRELGDNVVDYNPERVMIDDSSLEETLVVQPRDLLRRFVGVVDYTFGNYKLQPVSVDVQTHAYPGTPISRRSGPAGDLVITTFNVENLFDLVDDPGVDDTDSTPTPEALETQLRKLTLAIERELRLPEIIVVQEVENTAILQELGDRVNATGNGTDYTATSFESSDGRGIEVAFLWDANRVALVDAYPLGGSEVEAAFGPLSASPGREPLVGVFEVQGQTVTVIGNHFKSKSGDDPLYGVDWPPARSTEAQRKLQAQAVRSFVDTLFADDPEALVVVAGDLNDFPFGEPGEGDDHPLAILEGLADDALPLVDVVGLLPAAEAYTYQYDGNAQALDHLLISPALREMYVGGDVLHFNAAYPAALAANPGTPLHVSDHDPIEARFDLPAAR